MANKNSNDSRRKLLKSIAAGSGAVVAGKSLPESWSKPVIDSVMLPVHASTTDDTSDCDISPGCVLIWEGPHYYMWPGGSGPYPLKYFWTSSDCSGAPDGDDGEFGYFVIAKSPDEARSLFDAENISYECPFAAELRDPRIPDGCTLYWASTFGGC